MKKRIYISGKITGTADYMERFANAQKELEAQGYSALNPAAVGSLMPSDTEYEEYMDMCFTMLFMCDTIFMLKGWEDSPGANRERDFAMRYGYTILYEECEEGGELPC